MTHIIIKDSDLDFTSAQKQKRKKNRQRNKHFQRLAEPKHIQPAIKHKYIKTSNPSISQILSDNWIDKQAKVVPIKKSSLDSINKSSIDDILLKREQQALHKYKRKLKQAKKQDNATFSFDIINHQQKDNIREKLNDENPLFERRKVSNTKVPSKSLNNKTNNPRSQYNQDEISFEKQSWQRKHAEVMTISKNNKFSIDVSRQYI